MAIKKLVQYQVTCEGPCKQQFILEKIPPSWSRLKMEDAVQVIGHPLRYRVSTLCPDCRTKAEKLLKEANFKLNTVNYGGGTDGLPEPTVDRS